MEKRLFIPGSEWLYFKLYGGNKTADTFLSDALLPLGELLVKECLADKWFFIRYADPAFHIRFRIHIPDPRDYGKVFERVYPVFETLTEAKQVHKIQCDSYNRELERYGAERFDLTETWFYLDSVSILKALAELRHAADPDLERWKLVLRLIDDTLNAVDFSAAGKRDFMFARSEGFKKEFGYTAIPMIRRLNEKYRTNRKNIEDVFHSTVTELAAERAEQLKPIGRIVRSACDADPERLESYLAGMIHMTMNRLFHASNRMYELVIYDFLFRHYQSCVARGGK